MNDRIPWEYFILRRHIDNMGMINYYIGDSKQEACSANSDESKVLGIFGQHGYELCCVQYLRTGDTKYYFKRPAKA